MHRQTRNKKHGTRNAETLNFEQGILNLELQLWFFALNPNEIPHLQPLLPGTTNAFTGMFSRPDLKVRPTAKTNELCIL